MKNNDAVPSLLCMRPRNGDTRGFAWFRVGSGDRLGKESGGVTLVAKRKGRKEGCNRKGSSKGNKGNGLPTEEKGKKRAKKSKAGKPAKAAKAAKAASALGALLVDYGSDSS